MNKTKLTKRQRTALEEARELFSAWRETRAGRTRIPDDLWKATADLFHTWGISVNTIARSLRLNYSTLKTKIIDKPRAAIKPIDAASMFIELAPPQVCTDNVIEMENQSGLKMRMCFRGRADPAVISLARYFLENQP
jgi:hypothetical protein